MRKCYIKEGVNHIQNCKPVRSWRLTKLCLSVAQFSMRCSRVLSVLQLVEQYLDSIKVIAMCCFGSSYYLLHKVITGDAHTVLLYAECGYSETERRPI